MTRTMLATALCLVALAACGRRQPPPAVVAVPAATLGGVGVPLPSGATMPAAPAALSVDLIRGTYQGRAELLRNGGRCAPGRNVSLSMQDPVVRWRVDRSVPELQAPIALDGSFVADNGPAVIRGQFTPGRVDFDAGTATCGYRYALVKR